MNKGTLSVLIVAMIVTVGLAKCAEKRERDVQSSHAIVDPITKTRFMDIPLERCPDMPDVTIMRTKGRPEVAYLALGYEVRGSHKVCNLRFRIMPQQWPA